MENKRLQHGYTRELSAGVASWLQFDSKKKVAFNDGPRVDLWIRTGLVARATARTVVSKLKKKINRPPFSHKRMFRIEGPILRKSLQKLSGCWV
jgi:hypothetical protein